MFALIGTQMPVLFGAYRVTAWKAPKQADRGVVFIKQFPSKSFCNATS
jgi:hypothetical protein